MPGPDPLPHPDPDPEETGPELAKELRETETEEGEEEQGERDGGGEVDGHGDHFAMLRRTMEQLDRVRATLLAFRSSDGDGIGEGRDEDRAVLIHNAHRSEPFRDIPLCHPDPDPDPAAEVPARAQQQDEDSHRIVTGPLADPADLPEEDTAGGGGEDEEVGDGDGLARVDDAKQQDDEGDEDSAGSDRSRWEGVPWNAVQVLGPDLLLLGTGTGTGRVPSASLSSSSPSSTLTPRSSEEEDQDSGPSQAAAEEDELCSLPSRASSEMERLCFSASNPEPSAPAVVRSDQTTQTERSISIAPEEDAANADELELEAAGDADLTHDQRTRDERPGGEAEAETGAGQGDVGGGPDPMEEEGCDDVAEEEEEQDEVQRDGEDDSAGPVIPESDAHEKEEEEEVEGGGGVRVALLEQLPEQQLQRPVSVPASVGLEERAVKGASAGHSAARNPISNAVRAAAALEHLLDEQLRRESVCGRRRESRDWSHPHRRHPGQQKMFVDAETERISNIMMGMFNRNPATK